MFVTQKRQKSPIFSHVDTGTVIISRSGLVLLCKKPWKSRGWGGVGGVSQGYSRKEVNGADERMDEKHWLLPAAES